MVEVDSAVGSHTSRQFLVELAHCADSDLGTARWWTCVHQQLRRLDEDLGNEDIVGLVEQVTSEVPERLHSAHRIRRLHDSVRREAWQLAARVAHHSGTPASATAGALSITNADLVVTHTGPDSAPHEPGAGDAGPRDAAAAAEVRAALGLLLARLGRLHVLADALLIDTYSLDIGGCD